MEKWPPERAQLCWPTIIGPPWKRDEKYKPRSHQYTARAIQMTRLHITFCLIQLNKLIYNDNRSRMIEREREGENCWYVNRPLKWIGAFLVAIYLVELVGFFSSGRRVDLLLNAIKGRIHSLSDNTPFSCLESLLLPTTMPSLFKRIPFKVIDSCFTRYILLL